jgi:microcystin-dependent protein
MMLKIYPIGAIYQSTASTSPASLFGGTWASFGAGRVLVGSGTSDASYTAGATGDESNHTLTVAEMPSHFHHIYNNSYGDSVGNLNTFTPFLITSL